MFLGAVLAAPFFIGGELATLQAAAFSAVGVLPQGRKARGLCGDWIMQIRWKLGMAFAATFLLAACVSDGGYRSEGPQSISIPYDPYDFDPADLQEEADNHCSAYGMNAVFDGETVNQGSVRWRYRHYRCV